MKNKIISKIKKEIDLTTFEKKLERKIHLTIIEDLAKLDKEFQENIKNGWIIYGRI